MINRNRRKTNGRRASMLAARRPLFTADSPQRRLADPCVQPVSGTNGEHLRESLFMRECPWETLLLFTQRWRRRPFMMAGSK